MSPLLLLFLMGSVGSAHKDPDVGLDMEAITKSKGYPIEKHNVTTEDGYILGTFRIPYGRTESASALNIGKPVVLLQHGLLDSSWTFVSNFPGQSLAFILADKGYDVWLGNNRGNTYSKRHVSYPTHSKQFWNFTYDEMARFDTPNTIEFVLEYTNQSELAYAGHSEGSIQMFALPTFRPDLVPKIAFFGGLAPVAFVHHQKSPLLTVLAALDVADIFELLGVRQFLPGVYVLNRIAPELCEAVPEGCDDALVLLCGPTKDLNASRMSVYVSETPADTSVKNMVHWSQGVKHEAFRRFDYGSRKKNEAVYGPNHPEPPSYNLSAVTMPLGLYSGTTDWLADPKDVEALRAALPPGVTKQDTVIEGFAHLDFTWGMLANRSVYLEPNLLAQIERYLGPGIHGR